MIECAHWLPIMLEQETEEHETDRRELVRKSQEMKRALNDIRAVVNHAESHLVPQPPTLHEQLISAFERQRIEGMRPMNLADPRRYPAPRPAFSDIFGGIF